MAEQWIDAARALEIVKDASAICSRLHAGLIKARAARFQLDDVASDDVVIPKRFWWAEGGLALEQDWATGDFSTWIEQKSHCRAFGVKFELFGLLEMVAFERRGPIARSLSVASNGGWISAKDALAFAYSLGFSNPGPAIIEQGRLGFIAARAVMFLVGNPQVSPWEREEREWDIPPWFWQNFTKADSSHHDWSVGTFSGKGRAPTEVNYLTLRGVHFHGESLATMAGQESDPAPSAKRGRKTQYDWPTATSAIWGKLHRGELIPEVQADIETALISFLTKGDKSPSQSTVRPFAKPIWEEFEKP